jgi:hypothetical protein
VEFSSACVSESAFEEFSFEGVSAELMPMQKNKAIIMQATINGDFSLKATFKCALVGRLLPVLVIVIFLRLSSGVINDRHPFIIK